MSLIYVGKIDDWRLSDGDEGVVSDPVTVTVKDDYGYGGLGIAIERPGFEGEGAIEPAVEGCHHLYLEKDGSALVLRIFTAKGEDPQVALNIMPDGRVERRES